MYDYGEATSSAPGNAQMRSNSTTREFEDLPIYFYEDSHNPRSSLHYRGALPSQFEEDVARINQRTTLQELQATLIARYRMHMGGYSSNEDEELKIEFCFANGMSTRVDMQSWEQIRTAVLTWDIPTALRVYVRIEMTAPPQRQYLDADAEIDALEQALESARELRKRVIEQMRARAGRPFWPDRTASRSGDFGQTQNAECNTWRAQQLRDHNQHNQRQRDREQQ